VIVSDLLVVSVPLRGIGSEKQTAGDGGYSQEPSRVSVPLRGIGSEKLEHANQVIQFLCGSVSVPLRGIGSEKRLSSLA